MKKLLWIGLLASFLAPISASAQSPFDGTWKTDVANAKLPKKPNIYLLQNGTFRCQSCAPPFEIKADGQIHSVTGQPYFDAASLKVVDDWAAELTEMKNGKQVGTLKYAISTDGSTLTETASFISPANGETLTGKEVFLKTAKGPAGSHALSGSWRPGQIENMSQDTLLFTLKVDGDSLTMSNPTGEGYTAKLDGTPAPFHGDPGTTSVSVKLIDKNTIEETDMRDGKVSMVTRMTVSADGKSMMLASTDKLSGTTAQYEADKQ